MNNNGNTAAPPPTSDGSGVVPANAIAGAAVAACVVMAMGVGAYMLYKHKTAAQRNLIKRTTPTVKTINPAAAHHRVINFNDSNYVDQRVAFKPIKSARSFSV